MLERKTKAYVLGRIRAGVLEQGLVSLMEQAGCADPLCAEGIPHDGTLIYYGDGLCCINRMKDVLPLTPDGFSLRPQ